jgi:hypothetical protein
MHHHVQLLLGLISKKLRLSSLTPLHDIPQPDREQLRPTDLIFPPSVFSRIPPIRQAQPKRVIFGDVKCPESFSGQSLASLSALLGGWLDKNQTTHATPELKARNPIKMDLNATCISAPSNIRATAIKKPRKAPMAKYRTHITHLTP